MNTAQFNNALQATKAMDWMQPVLNDSPPCFHVGDDGRFCGRAERWDGHKSFKSNPPLHIFKSFDELLMDVAALGRKQGMEESIKVIAPVNAMSRSVSTVIRCDCQREIRKAI